MTINDPTSLTLKRVIEAPVSEVYAAWTDAEMLASWFLGNDAESCEIHEADARVGGRYDFEMRKPSGETHRVRGVYREVRPNEKLVFTWAWISTPERESLVMVEFKSQGDQTLLTLTHTRFADQAARDMHAQGWGGCLDRLAKRFAA